MRKNFVLEIASNPDRLLHTCSFEARSHLRDKAIREVPHIHYDICLKTFSSYEKMIRIMRLYNFPGLSNS